MHPRIRVLPDALVDQIAAGEVVERPASVVKELLENALDAQATTITVEVDGGGVGRIRVTDDGVGMTAEEAPLAVRRHATSKIATADDLVAIGTLGFRGEALPSIASVSRFTLLTRPADAIAGTRVSIEGGAGAEIREAGCAPGTTVEVSDLFYNVPARRKFLKSQATESAHVADTCLRIALSRPELRLTLVREGRRAREYLPAQDRAERARVVFASEDLTEIVGEREGVRLHAVLGAPERARSGAGALHLFVNGRPVRDRTLARAVAFAYGSVLPPGRYPSGVVWIDLPPGEVDVNVHPQKAEVRFARGRSVADAVTRLLASELGTTAWGGPAARGPRYWDRRLDEGPSAPAEPTADGSSRWEAASTGADPWGLTGAIRDAAVPYAPAPQGELVQPRGPFGSLRVLGQVRRMLLVCEGPDALYLVDQHAADERLRFHRLRTAHAAGRVRTQRLLFPERVELSEGEVVFLDEHREELERAGLDVTAVGPTTVAVHAVPALVQRAAPERLVRDWLAELHHLGERSFGDAVDMALATMACHGAIRAGDALSAEEGTELLRALDGVDEFAGHCPHGRPIVVTLPFDDIERRLGR